MGYYEQIKDKLINNEVTKRIKDYSKNKSDLQTYYDVGKLIIEAQGGEERAKYGDRLIKEYSIRLTKELNKKYSERNLRNMRQFYIKSYEIDLADNVCQISWSHYIQLIWFDDIDKINYYINITIN